MRKLGVIMLGVGGGIAAGYFIYYLVTVVVQFMPLSLRIAIAAATLGVIIVLVSLVRERVKSAREDKQKFKGVDR